MSEGMEGLQGALTQAQNYISTLEMQLRDEVSYREELLAECKRLREKQEHEIYSLRRKIVSMDRRA
jgi:hypothetical protein